MDYVSLLSVHAGEHLVCIVDWFKLVLLSN
mgnify:CR=1 FL=1